MQDPTKPIWVNQKPEASSKVQETRTNLSIFVATPVHSDCSIHYTQSLLRFQQFCMKSNILVSFSLMKSSLVTQGRNLSVSNFFEESKDINYDYFLFIDSDIEFTPETIIKLINADKDVIACPYPLKTIDWNKVYKRKENKPNMSADEMSKQGYTWPVKLEGKNTIEIKQGVAEVSHAPTGCMLIKKHVFEKMMKAFPELKINQPTIINGQYVEREYFYNFFDTYHEPETKRYYGEDFGFCKRWTEIGGKCHILVDDYITHVGEYRYTGRLADDLVFTKNVDEPNKNK